MVLVCAKIAFVPVDYKVVLPVDDVFIFSPVLLSLVDCDYVLVAPSVKSDVKRRRLFSRIWIRMISKIASEFCVPWCVCVAIPSVTVVVDSDV